MKIDPTHALTPGSWNIPLRRDQPAPDPRRPAAMFEVRESSYNDETLFTAMLEQTYAPFAHNPWVKAILDAGIAPMHAESYTFEVSLPGSPCMAITVLIQRTRRDRTVVSRFQVGPFVHVWSMSSAANTNARGDNDFTGILVNEITETRPQVLIAANISRLVRSDQEGGLLLKVLPNHVDEIWAGPQVMKLVGDGSEYGRMMFSVLGSVAAMERNWIVTRLLAGRIAAWRRGEWLYGKHIVPFGYKLNTSRQLVPDPDMREKVRQVLIALGADEPSTLTTRRLADLGMTSTRGRLLTDTARAHNNPTALIDSLLSWTPLWTTGETVWRYSSPMKDAKLYSGIPVSYHEDDEGSRGELQLLLTPGLPEGGWAEQEVLDRLVAKARARYSERLRDKIRRAHVPLADHIRSASAHTDVHESMLGLANGHRNGVPGRARARGTSKVAPFSGLTWNGDLGPLELMVASHDQYKIVQRLNVSTHDDTEAGSPQ